MGLDTTAVKFVCAAKSVGVDFRDTLTVGRQNFISTPSALKRVFDVHDIQDDPKEFVRKHRFADEFFIRMGAERADSLDYSDYQNASVIQDMNSPILDELKSRYSVVYDGGTIEHVFNIPQALKNCMEMVSVGGYFLQANIANNFMGHGFWQFSPELVFRSLSAENGFEIVAVLLHEVLPDAGWVCRNEEWYLVTDPDDVGERVELRNRFPTYILTIAKRTAEVEVFKNPPQQSDYSRVWHDHSTNSCGNTTQHGVRSSLKKSVPPWAKDVWHRMHRFQKSLRGPFRRPYYSKIKESDLLHGRFGESGERVIGNRKTQRKGG